MSSIDFPVPDWAMRTAESLLATHGVGPHVVATGISPSGNIHVGNLREVLVGEAVVNALRTLGSEAHFVFHAATIHHHTLPIDRAGNLISLGFVVVLPLILLYLDGSRATPARRTIEGTQRG